MHELKLILCLYFSLAEVIQIQLSELYQVETTGFGLILFDQFQNIMETWGLNSTHNQYTLTIPPTLHITSIQQQYRLTLHTKRTYIQYTPTLKFDLAP